MRKGARPTLVAEISSFERAESRKVYINYVIRVTLRDRDEPKSGLASPRIFLPDLATSLLNFSNCSGNF